MKHIKLYFEDEKFEKLKREKEKAEKISEERVSWENFVFGVVFGRLKHGNR
jgi:hypothetical protein